MRLQKYKIINKVLLHQTIQNIILYNIAYSIKHNKTYLIMNYLLVSVYKFILIYFYNLFRMTSTRIKVAIRLRPFLNSEIKNGYQNSKIKIHKESNEINVKVDQYSNNAKNFKFDYVFGQNSTQDNVYHGCNIDNLVDRAIQGYHSTIFAYGQTGSGKTFTMQGVQQQSQQSGKQSQLTGIIPKIVTNLFKKIKNKSQSRTFTVYISYLQIYNQKIFDLLNPSSLNPKNINSKISGGLRLRWNKNQQFSVQNLFIFQCKGPEELLKFFSYGLSNRITSSHKLNMTSSRSHSILSIRVQSFDHANPNNILSSKIQLVDLAGSQRIGLTGNEGRQAKQSIDINKSLFTLRQVISTLAEWNRKKGQQQLHIPYRQSKLTSILKQSIGGNSYCLMIACINPCDEFLDENISTLTYATKTTYITNKPVINDDPRNKIILELKYQIQDLYAQLDKANKHIEIITQMNSNNNNSNPNRPATQKTQKLYDEESSSPKLLLKKKSTQKGGASYDQFSERLVESINMVRELLKSNKQLREQLQVADKKIEQKDVQIYQLSRQNQRLRDNGTILPQVQINSATRKLKTPLSSTQYGNNFGRSQNPIVYSNNLGSSGNNMIGRVAQHAFNSAEINQYYHNQPRDNIPTNFNKRDLLTQGDNRLNSVSSSQNSQLQKQHIDRYRKTVSSILNKKGIPQISVPALEKKGVIYDHFRQQQKNNY